MTCESEAMVGKTAMMAKQQTVEQRDWSRNRALWMRLLEERTGEGVSAWMRKIKRARLTDEASLRAWLAELIDRQYAGRLDLRPVYEAVLAAALELGDVVIQARKTYVSLLTPRRTFARIQPTTRTRVDLALRIDRRPAGRLRRSTIHSTMPVQLGLASVHDLDAEAVALLREAYQLNCA
jgi:hypothetical protein